MTRDLRRPLREPWIVDAVRTPIGRYGGALAAVRPDDLAALVIRALVDRTAIDPSLIEDVILGCANQAGEDNRNVARMALLLAGLPIDVGGLTVNRLCGSGLQAINSAAHAIAVDDGDAFIAGGVESMTRAPYVMAKPEAAWDRGPREVHDTTLGWRFVNPKLAAAHYPYSMGETAENVAEQWGVSRERQDLFALESHLRSLAAIEAGCPFINFTPSLGIDVPAIRERADHLGLPYMGRDGKTGETLVKSILAPMFAMRNLSVLSWVGQNILGNRDGAVLRDPKTRLSKIQTKDKIVSRIVGRSPTTLVSIDYVPSLDDWKVAWDFIHFEGFLGTKMSMQFTWCGSDSILAAPLIIDLVRFAALEYKRGGSGPMRHLGFFFKDPIEVEEHDLSTQWQWLVEHVTDSPLSAEQHLRSSTGPVPPGRHRCQQGS